MADTDLTPVLSPGTDTLEAKAGPRERLRQHLSEPFARNAYSLILNTGLTGALGVAYWLVAARTYRDSDVGRGSVTISVMTLLAGIVALNLTGTLTRFIGPSGRGAFRLVGTAYLFTAVVAAALATGFLLTLSWWGPSYVHLTGWWTGLWFVAAVVAAAVFTVQDGVLTGLRRAGWVPVENAAFGVAKLALLIPFAARDPRDGVYLSWVIPMAVLLLPVSALIFGRLIPRHVRAAEASRVIPTRSQIGRFFAADYLGALCVFATSQLVPVLVATQVQLYSFGYFYIAWTIGMLLITVAANMGSSLTVEGAYDPSTIGRNCRAAINRTLFLLLLAALVVALVAPYGLRVLGKGYPDAWPLLQLLALAALPAALIEIYVGVLRAQNATGRIAVVQAVRGVLVVGSVLLIARQASMFGQLVPSVLTRVGIAVLGSQLLLAAFVLPRLRSVVRSDTGAPAVPALRVGSPSPGPATAFGGGGAAGLLAAPQIAPPALAPVQSPARGRRADLRSPRRGRAEGRRPGWVAPGLVVLATVGGVVLYVLPLRGLGLERMNGYGLISVLPGASLGGLTILVLAFVGALGLRRAHPAILTGQVVLAVLCLHGLPVLVESMPRFPTAWVHMGFIEYISRTGATAPGLDARYSWPGFFALFSFLTDGRGWHDLRWLVALAPVASNLLYLLPLALIVWNMRAGWRARWTALWLFPVLNWVGQDYFSPQGLTYFLYLCVVAILVTWFRPTGRSPLTSLRLWSPVSRVSRFVPRPLVARYPGEVPPAVISRGEQVVLLSLIVVLFGFTAASHQLTPFLMIAACVGLLLAGRCTLRGLPALLVAILVAWISFMTVGYWSGHLGELLGGLGELTGNVSTSVAGRTSNSGAEHLAVLHLRIGLAVAVAVLALIGVWRRRRRGFDDRVALVLLISPVIAPILQSYGGEVLLRAFLFALPAACILAGYAFFPGSPLPRRRDWRGIVAAAVCLPLLATAFLVARYGNEAFEYVRPGEVAALDYVYAHSRGPTDIAWLTANPANISNASFVTGYRAMDRVGYQPIAAPRNPADDGPLIDRLRELGSGTYLITTRAQEAELVLAEAFPAGWGDRFRSDISTAPGVRTVVSNPDAVVYQVSPPAPGAITRGPSNTGVRGWTPLTPAGALCFVVLAVVLFVREVRRLTAAPGVPVRVTAWTMTAVPLALALVVVVIERMAVLS